jgi:hypothetical protein
MGIYVMPGMTNVRFGKGRWSAVDCALAAMPRDISRPPTETLREALLRRKSAGAATPLRLLARRHRYRR